MADTPLPSDVAQLPTLDFERPLVELELRIDRLRALSATDASLVPSIDALSGQLLRLREEAFASLSRWQVVQLARHPARPSPLDYIERLIDGFTELHGDRRIGDDPAIIGGLGRLAGRPVLVIGHARGRNPAENVARRYGMPQPEGFRKVERLARLADHLGLPIVTFIDTPGAHPGADAEERGQAMAIAACLECFAGVRVPVVAMVVGEGGSGGALALAVADVLLMQRYAVFAVISPEACSSILYRDGAHAPESAESLRLTAPDLEGLSLVDAIVGEPSGGAHRDASAAIKAVGAALERELARLVTLDPESRRVARRRRLRSYGAGVTTPGSA